ncbi:MAG TPA: methylated-DNA--[protein]-cysteine S-methyltransferase [Kineosporiaceae bacterium]|nr:methylated-DNA--[protein]-cysteine S-methyltransferase [Kineosporiaceae bacterium]
MLGEVTLVASGDFIVGSYWAQQSHKPSTDSFGPRVDFHSDALLDEARVQLEEYFGGDRSSFELKTATHGDPFQERVWAMLNEIPIGKTTTYGELAERLGDKSLAQSVGQAVGRNPLCIVVPCHRVVGKGGKLTGYAGGLRRKQFLLELEEPALVRGGKLF